MPKMAKEYLYDILAIFIKYQKSDTKYDNPILYIRFFLPFFMI